jgi:hypothetical protein
VFDNEFHLSKFPMNIILKFEVILGYIIDDCISSRVRSNDSVATGRVVPYMIIIGLRKTVLIIQYLISKKSVLALFNTKH